ncbi:Rieske 2Fe-2S domain-containing protein [Halobellus rufus]|uniref:Rieske 2Fe-2S domain-containing protein n=1 Tax=Halobellus rufus TaxID=1448860 RepID=UPI0009DD8253|nr:Rieske 2Fe-2S domain-containing protein [Halobellus rufus]
MSTRIGPDSLLKNLPQSVKISGREYIISRNPDGDPIIFSSECPHQGSVVEVANEECLRCPRHQWEFDPETGDSTTVPNESLSTYDLNHQDGHLYADLPQVDATLDFNVSNDKSLPPRINLLSHATLSIEYNGFRLVTDPWLDGPAFLDSWTQYPPPTCDITAVTSETDAIWITHEHPDHLHPRTLDHFHNETPIYVPELNYRRLSTRLHDIGFENVHSLPTDTPYELADDVEAVCFKSNSTWNDSILALNCGGFKILNFNDAGVNWKVNRAIPDADLIAAGFAFGASGYPITWSHLDVEHKKQMIKERNEQCLRQCEQLVDMFDADYFLPFAKFFELIQPKHNRYRDLMEKNRPSDVVEYLDDHKVTVLDLLPGEVWYGQNDRVDRRPNREQFFDEEFKEQYLQNTFESQEPVVNKSIDLTHNELEAYFESLNDSELVSKIEDFALTLSLTGEDKNLNSIIHITNGDVEYLITDGPVSIGEFEAENHVSMSCPVELVQYVVRNDRSWDDIHIGYWCDFDRHPDEYNLEFWRLLHAPWEARNDTMRIADRYDIETELTGTTIADLVEKEDIQDILATYGLHCAGCPQGIGEDIIEAARIHGLNPDQAQQLVDELEARVSNSHIVSY